MSLADDVVGDELEEAYRRRHRILSAVDDVAGCYNALAGFEDTVPRKLRDALNRLNAVMAQ